GGAAGFEAGGGGVSRFLARGGGVSGFGERTTGAGLEAVGTGTEPETGGGSWRRDGDVSVGGNGTNAATESALHKQQEAQYLPPGPSPRLEQTGAGGNGNRGGGWGERGRSPGRQSPRKVVALGGRMEAVSNAVGSQVRQPASSSMTPRSSSSGGTPPKQLQGQQQTQQPQLQSPQAIRRAQSGKGGQDQGLGLQAGGTHQG
ncbi:unnamed protein product, partial [Choristocarpus tenellus]